jgi:CheY-like chemotaxis protein
MSHSEFSHKRHETRFLIGGTTGRVAEIRGRVLVVHNDKEIRHLIAASLTLEGFDVSTAVDGQDCLDRVLEIAPDVIALDAMMPRLDGLDGRETAARLRRHPGTSHVKVVLTVTGHMEEAHPTDDADSGIDACLDSPFDARELIRVVRALIPSAWPPVWSRSRRQPCDISDPY